VCVSLHLRLRLGVSSARRFFGGIYFRTHLSQMGLPGTSGQRGPRSCLDDTRLLGYQQRRWNEIVLTTNEICPCGPSLSGWPDTTDSRAMVRTAHTLPAFFVRLPALGSLAPGSRNISDSSTAPFAIRRRHKSFPSAKRQKQTKTKHDQRKTESRAKTPPESVRTAKTARRTQGSGGGEYLQIHMPPLRNRMTCKS